jgi:Fanconi anemia group M protein
MTSDSPVVIVDTREPKTFPIQLRSYGFTVVEDTLDAGDFCFFPHGLKAGIERKRIDDLLNSLRDNRMVSQAHKMIETYDVPMLLIEGRYDRAPSGIVTYEANGKWFESGWSWDSFSGMMLDLKWMGLVQHQCMSGDAAREIARIVGSLCKKEHAWIRQRERATILTIDPQYKNACWGLCAFGGVGPEWASAMLNHFGSFGKVIASEVRELAEVVGESGKRFGPKRAAKLRKEWDETWDKT